MYAMSTIATMEVVAIVVQAVVMVMVMVMVMAAGVQTAVEETKSTTTTDYCIVGAGYARPPTKLVPGDTAKATKHESRNHIANHNYYLQHF